METWIRHACRQRAYRQLVAWVLLTVGAVTLAVLNSRYWANFFEGPYTLTASDLSAIQDPGSSPRQFVAITGDKVIDTGIQEITTETRNGVKQGSHVSSGYYALILRDKFLVVKNPVPPALRVEGQLSSVPSNLLNSLFADPANAGLRPRMYPFYLTTDNYRVPGYTAIGLAMILGFLLWRFALPTWRHTQDISQHPVVKRTEAWTYAIETAVQAEREMTTAVRYKRPGAVVTDNFLIRRSFFRFNIFLFNDLLWTYKKVTQRLVNFVPVGKSYDGILVFYGGHEAFKAKEAVIDNLLLFAANRSPWAIRGYSDELSRTFRKDTTGFCAAVEERRQEWAAATTTK